MAVPCSSCYVVLNRANSYFNESPEIRTKVSEALAAGGLQYRGTQKVRHMLDIIVNDVGYDTIKSRVKKDLAGLK